MFESWYFLGTKMPKFRNLGSKFLKTNVRFQITTFDIENMRSFIKIRKLILFGLKCPNLEIFARHLREKNDRSEISTLKIWCRLILFGPKCLNLRIWLKIWKTKAGKKNSRFTQFWNFGSIRVVSQFFKGCSGGFGSFRLVSGRFGSFRILVSTLVCLLKQLMGELTFVTVLFSEVFYKQTVLKNFGNVLEKQVCWNLCLIKFIICFIFINAIRIL